MWMWTFQVFVSSLRSWLGRLRFALGSGTRPQVVRAFRITWAAYGPNIEPDWRSSAPGLLAMPPDNATDEGRLAHISARNLSYCSPYRQGRLHFRTAERYASLKAYPVLCFDRLIAMQPVPLRRILRYRSLYSTKQWDRNGVEAVPKTQRCANPEISVRAAETGDLPVLPKALRSRGRC